MRNLRMILATVFSLALMAVPEAAAQAPPGRSTEIVHPSWHRVAGNVESVSPGGRYLALTGLRGGVTLYDKQTKTRQPIVPPACPAGGGDGGAAFGGPWLAFECPSAAGGALLDLYDLEDETWSETSINSEGCDQSLGTACQVDGIGSTWIRLMQSNGLAHATYTWYLQNIATGEVEPDPADAPGPPVQDDLDTASGTATLCAAVTAPAFHSAYGPTDGAPIASFWHQFGNYLLITGTAEDEGGGSPDHLYRCGSSRALLDLPRDTFVSTQAVVHQNAAGARFPRLNGRFLPSLRSFSVLRPKGLVVAMSNRTIYTIFYGALWAGTLPRQS